MSVPNLIQCRDHYWSPWAIVCIHIIKQTATEVVPIPEDEGEVENHWVCAECAEKDHSENISNLRPVCIHCLRKIMEPYGVLEE